MKKMFITAALALVGYIASAQIHAELGINFNSPQGDFADSYDLGIGWYIEPKYAMTENIDLGLYFGRNAFAGANIDGFEVEATALTPVLATGTYRFSENNVTPYAGLGLGLYFAEAVDFDIFDDQGNLIGTAEGESSSEFGFAPRVGVYLGRLNLGIAYNIVSDANYLQFNLGVRILSRD